MDTCEILALIFAILLCLSTIPNILTDIAILLWSTYLAWLVTVANLAVSIIVMVGSCRPLSANVYKTCMILLIIADVISLLDMIVFLIYYLFLWAKLVNILIITPLIIFIENIRKKREMTPIVNPVVAVGNPLVVQNSPYPNNYQPGYV